MALALLTDGTFRPQKVKDPKTYNRKTKHKPSHRTDYGRDKGDL